MAGLQEKPEYCFCCGIVDELYDEHSIAIHNAGPKHICNMILHDYHSKKKSLRKNREGIIVMASAVSKQSDGTIVTTVDKTDSSKIHISIKPVHRVKFSFEISSILKNSSVLILCVQLGHPQHHFVMNKHPFSDPAEPCNLENKSVVSNEISVQFEASDIGQYEMPIIFTFKASRDDKEKYIIIVRDLVVNVEEKPVQYISVKSPYTKQDLEIAEKVIPSLVAKTPEKFKIPKLLKKLLPRGLREETLEILGRGLNENVTLQLRQLFHKLRSLFAEGITKENYVHYFHTLLWWEEIIGKINIKRYNMSGVTLTKSGDNYILAVPGLAEKRPSLLRGDSVYLQPHENLKLIFDSKITNITEDTAHLGNIDRSFESYYNPQALFDIRFIMSRVPMVRCHEALQRLEDSGNFSRIFPEPVRYEIPLKSSHRFYNKSIASNPQQKSAVEHIVSGTSGLAPYIVFGPPGTGKTVTIVEAIVQLVASNKKNRVMVCTDSNMAADHIALTLLKYRDALNIKNFLLRANSQIREWASMPAELVSVSNGKCYNSFKPVDNKTAANYRVIVTTLLHAAKYAAHNNQMLHNLKMSHLFIDEASQGSEPGVLIPVTGLLATNGRLILAGDPKQLGPVCVSREAGKLGLGTSLLERLYDERKQLYDNNPTYITTLVKNFRSHSDILQIPNELFYENQLQALAPLDKLSSTSILGLPGGDRAIVFHSMNSTEQRSGNAPSYFNQKELEMVQRYVKALIERHNVLPEEIGVIAPYIRQVYKVRNWLNENFYDKVEAGTVEAFQGKEKRVILVSTVRANCRLLDYDARYGLGFLVDDKRFNVTITRAKAKLVIIGNETCLKRDLKWRLYMDQCKVYKSYFGQENEQMDRNSQLLIEVAKTRFNKCHMTEVLKKKDESEKENKGKKGKKKKGSWIN